MYNNKAPELWNQKLQKGDEITVNDKNNKPSKAFIGGFYSNQDLQDDDTYEENKNNNWHQWRGIKLTDKAGNHIGNINANQIIGLNRKIPGEYKEAMNLYGLGMSRDEIERAADDLGFDDLEDL